MSNLISHGIWNRKRSSAVSLVICFLLIILFFVVLFILPTCLDWYYIDYHNMSRGDAYNKIRTSVLSCFYICAPFAAATLYSLTRLLLNIYHDNTFIKSNVLYLFCVSWCCYLVTIVTFIGGFFYIPLFFIAVAAGYVGTLVRVVKNVMQSAEELREENDLTI